MNKNEFMEIVLSVVKGSRAAFSGAGGADLPKLRLLFNNMTDSYCKDGLISNSQYNNWVLTDRELKKLINAVKGK